MFSKLIVNQKIQHEFSNKFEGKQKLKKALINGSDYYALKIIKCLDQTEQIKIRTILEERNFINTQQTSTPQCTNDLIITTTNDQTGKNKYLLVYSPYKYTVPLIPFVSISSQDKVGLPEKAQRIFKIVNQLVLLLMKASNNQFYTPETFLLEIKQDDSLTVSLNTASMTGMDLLYASSQQTPQLFLDDFIQIYELLDQSFLKTPKKQRKLGLQQKLKSIGFLILQMIFENNLSFIDDDLLRQKNTDKKIQMQEIIQNVLNLSKKFEEFLGHPEVIAKIQEIDKITTTHYREFMNSIFVKKKELTWTETIKLICPQWTKETQNIDKPPLSIYQIAKLHAKSLTDSERKKYRELGLLQQPESNFTQSQKEKENLNPYIISLLYDSQPWNGLECLLGFEDLDSILSNPVFFDFEQRIILINKLTQILHTLQNKFISFKIGLNNQQAIEILLQSLPPTQIYQQKNEGMDIQYKQQQMTQKYRCPEPQSGPVNLLPHSTEPDHTLTVSNKINQSLFNYITKYQTLRTISKAKYFCSQTQQAQTLRQYSKCLQ